jgi:two-component system sensor histidine kinase HydH
MGCKYATKNMSKNGYPIIRNTMKILRLKNPQTDRKTEESYERIDRAISKMSRQISDVLDFVRTSNPVTETTSLQTILKDTVNGLDIPSNARIIFPDQDVEVYGDSKQLETVFSNLILNAIQANDNGGKVMIQTSESDNHTIIDVVDNGRGIEKENLQGSLSHCLQQSQTELVLVLQAARQS